MHFDRNYLRAGEEYPELLAKYSNIEEYYKGFQAVSKPGTAFLRKVADHNANLAYLRIIKGAEKSDKDLFFSVVVNRWHDDVTTLYEEDLRLRPELDSAAFIEGFIGSYPNYFFEVHESELPEFFTMLKTYDGSKESLALLDKFGVNRAKKEFWTEYDEFQDKFNKSDPVQAGIFDLNRYYYRAMLDK